MADTRVTEALRSALLDTKCSEPSQTILVRARELVANGHWNENAGMRLLNVVRRIDGTGWAVDEYVQYHPVEGRLPSNITQCLRTYCQVTREMLGYGVSAIHGLFQCAEKIAPTSPHDIMQKALQDEKRTAQAAVLTENLLTGIEEAARATHNLAKIFAVVTGAAVLAFATYAIWRSTQSESSRQYIVV